MKLYQLRAIQIFPRPVTEIWDFMSNPKNLSRITPPDMQFTTVSGESDRTYAGQIITYTIKPLLGIPMDWVTEITHVKDNEYFVDEQRFGPYSFWHHQHFLKEVAGGTEMTDIVHYKVPLGFLGRMVHPILVRPKLEHIFDYRKKVLSGLFGEIKNETL
ncbi:SRPBCC family protein [Flavobacterium silvaticum]|uniref:SRPBCC family protein n=1 Tax=Flavobacterium silvaticum TaxID=1852020 RepID=A0A972G1U8_9FLAO|nr:SRPBCC family protein [Flavobacterium silvaticum]NMH28911.1 SRPBCC family protein [Flavobacterium silvaticum]